MKKAENIVNEIASFGTANQPFWYVNTTKALDAIREAQTEAWNEAIKAAAEKAELESRCYNAGEILRQNIGQEVSIGSSSNYIGIDKETILKLLK